MKPQSHLYIFLRDDGETERGCMTPQESRDKARYLAKQSGRDVLVYRMIGAVRVRYNYVPTRSRNG